MKKLSILFCAALAALAVLSCSKESKEEPVIAPDTQVNTLSNTAVSLLKEADPNYWGEFAKTAQSLIADLKTIHDGNLGMLGVKAAVEGEEAPEEAYTLDEDIENWFRAVEDRDNVRFFITTTKLSLITGDITVREVGEEIPKDAIEIVPEEGSYREFVYTRSKNPLNLTYVFNGKTYKFQFEAVDSDNNTLKNSEYSGTGYYTTNQDGNEVWVGDGQFTRINQIAFPSKVALHVTENGATFIDVAIYPEVKDTNWNSFIESQRDEFCANATVQVPGYTLKVSDAKFNISALAGKIELFHGNNSLIAIDGEIEFDALAGDADPGLPPVFDEDSGNDIVLGPRNKRGIYVGDHEIGEYIKEIYTVVQKVQGKVKLMGGNVILDGVAYPHQILKLATRETYIYDEDDARRYAAKLAPYLHVNLCYNNGSRVQSQLVYQPIKEGEHEVPKTAAEPAWVWTWGLLFPDQTFKTFEELGDSEDFDAVIGQLAIWMAHGNAIFSEEDSVEPEPLHE
jgi:hypothetical protein